MNDDIKPDISKIDVTSKEKTDIKEKNLELADDIALTRVSEKSKVSLRHLARKNYILDALQEKPVWEGLNDLYKVCKTWLWFVFFGICRSNHLQMFFIISVLKNFPIFTGIHLCWSLFLIKLQVLKPVTLLKRDSNTGLFL